MALPTPPIKTDLFRFVTFRSPEEFSADQHMIRFVQHPDLLSSEIHACPVPEPDHSSNDPFDSFTADFPRYVSKAALQDQFLEYYDFAMAAVKAKTPIADLVIEADAGFTRLDAAQEETLFEALIGHILTQEYPESRKAIANLLIVNHALAKQTELADIGLTKLTDIMIEVPKEVFSCRKPWFFNQCGGSLEGLQSLGVADFRKVEQEICCYLPGEVSHVENVMAKEYKERSTRNLIRTEDTIETERETSIENLSDLTTTTRNEMSSEVANVVEQDQMSNYGGSLGVSGKVLGARVNVNAYADFSTSNATSYSNTEAHEYAKEVTNRALERITQRTSEKRTSKIIKEFEENNKHGFDNRGDAAKNVTGIYRWLDIQYKNRLVNYGKRLMVEFMVPEPAEFYKTVLRFDPLKQEEEDNEPEAPRTLADFGIESAEDINDLVLANAGSYFGVVMDPLPDTTMSLTKSLAPQSPVYHNRNINSKTYSPVVVPPDYEADTITGSYTYSYKANSGWNPQAAFCNFTFGGNTVNSGTDYSATKKSKTVNVNLNLSPNPSGSIPVSVGYSGCYGFYGAVSVNCVLKASVINDWKNNAYNALIMAYDKMLEEYNQEMAIQAEEDALEAAQIVEDSDPAMNRIIEQRELKRICIEMLMKPYCYDQGRDNNVDENACDKYMIPQVNQNAQFTAYSRTVKFFEQAIDWQIMSYLFYPYYWADKCDWAELMQSKSDDHVFQAFLQSGMGRVVVPIRQQFMRAFVYYIETGEIWTNNDLVPGSDGDLYLSLEEEMQTVTGQVEDVWETRVPTSLNIIQEKSATLQEEGLPCCPDVENAETTSNIIMSTDSLDLGTNPA